MTSGSITKLVGIIVFAFCLAFVNPGLAELGRADEMTLYTALSNDNDEIAAELFAKAGPQKTDYAARAIILLLMNPVKTPKTSTIKILLSTGLDVNFAQKEPELKGSGSLLHVAALVTKDPEVVRLLCQAGAEVNCRGEMYMTPLMAAIAGNNPGNVEVLLDAGAEASLKDATGKTALDYALESKDFPKKILERLKKATGDKKN